MDYYYTFLTELRLLELMRESIDVKKDMHTDRSRSKNLQWGIQNKENGHPNQLMYN